MLRSTLPRHRFARTSAEGGGGGQIGGAGAASADGQQTSTSTGANNQQSTGPEMAKDGEGKDLGFPLHTALVDMKPEQKAAYWTHEAAKQRDLAKQEQRAREEAARQSNPGSGTVRNQQQTQGAQSDDAAVQARIDEARREGQRDAVVVSLTASLQMRGKTTDEITEILDVIDPGKFLDANGKVDTTKVANHLARVAPAGTSNGGGGAPGQGRQGDSNQRTDPREIAREEAKKRGYLDPGANRGALGGLRK